jgi:hypothetical protein
MSSSRVNDMHGDGGRSPGNLGKLLDPIADGIPDDRSCAAKHVDLDCSGRGKHLAAKRVSRCISNLTNSGAAGAR